MKPRQQLGLSPQQSQDLNQFLSASRMAKYSMAMRSGPVPANFGTLDLYVYNMALAGAFLGPIHLLEVVTRNAIHEKFSQYTGQADWWKSPNLFLMARHKQKIFDTEQRLLDYRTAVAQRQAINGIGVGIPVPISPNDVIGAMEFGIWCDLLGKGVPGNPALDYELKIWQPILKSAFPRLRGDRHRLWLKMDSARRLRNRVSHHEPIHGRNNKRDYEDIRLLLNFVSPHIATWMDDRSRLIPEVIECKPGTPLQACYF